MWQTHRWTEHCLLSLKSLSSLQFSTERSWWQFQRLATLQMLRNGTVALVTPDIVVIAGIWRVLKSAYRPCIPAQLWKHMWGAYHSRSKLEEPWIWSCVFQCSRWCHCLSSTRHQYRSLQQLEFDIHWQQSRQEHFDFESKEVLCIWQSDRTARTRGGWSHSWGLLYRFQCQVGYPATATLVLLSVRQNTPIQSADKAHHLRSILYLETLGPSPDTSCQSCRLWSGHWCPRSDYALNQMFRRNIVSSHGKGLWMVVVSDLCNGKPVRWCNLEGALTVFK